MNPLELEHQTLVGATNQTRGLKASLLILFKGNCIFKPEEYIAVSPERAGGFCGITRHRPSF